MQGHDAESREADNYFVLLQGGAVECVSIEDAIAVRNADDFLSGRNAGKLSAADLDRIVLTLARYGRDFAANMVEERATRMRVAAFIQDKVGIDSPT